MKPLGLEFTLYFASSALALGVDVGVYALLMKGGFGYPVAAAAGFALGLAVAYMLSVRFVFRIRSVADERLEFVLFAAIGLVGVLLTEALLWLFVERAGIAPLPAKFATAGFVFCFNFGARKALLFTRQRKAALA